MYAPATVHIHRGLPQLLLLLMATASPTVFVRANSHVRLKLVGTASPISVGSTGDVGSARSAFERRPGEARSPSASVITTDYFAPPAECYVCAKRRRSG